MPEKRKTWYPGTGPKKDNQLKDLEIREKQLKVEQLEAETGLRAEVIERVRATFPGTRLTDEQIIQAIDESVLPPLRALGRAGIDELVPPDDDAPNDATNEVRGGDRRVDPRARTPAGHKVGTNDLGSGGSVRDGLGLDGRRPEPLGTTKPLVSGPFSVLTRGFDRGTPNGIRTRAATLRGSGIVVFSCERPAGRRRKEVTFVQVRMGVSVA